MAEVTSPASNGRAKGPWKCFHCGDKFGTRAAAAEHFGPAECSKPACTIDIAEYRAMEVELARWRMEDTDLHRQIERMSADHSTALRREEEKGYARGLADGRGLARETTDSLPSMLMQQSTVRLQRVRSLEVVIARLIEAIRNCEIDGESWVSSGIRAALTEAYGVFPAMDAAAIARLAETTSSSPLCVCGQPEKDGIVHRTDGPCYFWPELGEKTSEKP